MKDEHRSLILSLREACKRAIWTMAALPDPDARFQRYKGWAFDIVDVIQEAYGYSAPRVRRFQPSPQDIMRCDVAMSWLAWLKQTEGPFALKRITGWAMGVPLWRIAQLESCSEQSVMNRIDRSMAAILSYFGSEKIEVEVNREPKKRDRPLHYISERPADLGQVVELTRTYVGGKGFMKGSRVLRDGSEKIKHTRG